MQRVFNVYSDPGHGWARIPLRVIYDLHLENRISGYSYQRGMYAYLEEDCDLSLFIQAYRDRTGQDPQFNEASTNKYSKIRGYMHYAPPNPPQKTSTI